MAEPAKDNDQSMEDILQSIKRIIADEGEPAPTPAGSDVLELTELLAEDVAVEEPAPLVVEVEEVQAAPSLSIDDIMAMPISHEPQQPSAPKPAPAPEPEPDPSPVFAAAPEPAPVEKLLSDTTLAAAKDALSALANIPHPSPAYGSPHFRSGTTVEDLVIETLKPMLKEWLDGNLPAMVRTLVEKEVRRLSGN